MKNTNQFIFLIKIGIRRERRTYQKIKFKIKKSKSDPTENQIKKRNANKRKNK